LEKVATIDRLGQRTEMLLDALLHYSRVGRTEAKTEPVDLNVLLNDVRDQLAGRLAERPSDIVVPEPLPTITGDPLLLAEVFANLVSNAIKYNESARPRIEIGWEQTVGQPIQYRIRDNGIGIPAEYRDTVFRIFKR